MKVDVKKSVATVTMSLEDLGVIQYALAEGVEKLQSKAIYLKHAKGVGVSEAKKIAKRAKR